MSPPSDTTSTATVASESKSPETSPTKKKEAAEVVSKAMEYLISGKRNLLVQDVTGATRALEEACRMLGKQFGETGRECGEAYFYYGKALLELARMESGVIDNAFDGDSEEDSKDDDEEEDEEEAEDEAMEEDAAAEDSAEKEGKETESIGSNEAGSSESKDGQDKDAVEKEEEEDPSNLQLSWEMLELSKSIFQKHADSITDPKDDKRAELELRLTEVYQLLGEVSIENENYEQAVEDLNSCLRRREEILPSDSRSIAETHYQLGVALGFNLRFDDAVKALESSIGVLSSRVTNLKDKKESVDPSKKDDTFYTREKEIEEIEKLIPEIKEKIADTRDLQEETLKKIRGDAFGVAPEKKTNGSSEKEDKPVTNITSLVKKRKKSGEDLPNGEEASKKPHLEENGGDKKAAETSGADDVSSTAEKPSSATTNGKSSSNGDTEAPTATTA
eukprot:TRINITY_DN134_c0_g1_i3.p1 TRINITY_DN134_c0_g1~~TRINITY_DN134_c0_g1_i3.p1  ORF type:complete len:448 (-),score=226.38 TRINITY_DN134_c0_g1_i3:5-1348(-)